MTIANVRPGTGPEGYIPSPARPEQLELLHVTAVALYRGIDQGNVFIKGVSVDPAGTITIPRSRGLRDRMTTESSANAPYLRIWRPSSTIRMELGEPSETDYNGGLFTHHVLVEELDIDAFGVDPTGTRSQHEVVIQAWETNEDDPTARRHIRQEVSRTPVGVDAPVSVVDFSRGYNICSDLHSTGLEAQAKRGRHPLAYRLLGALGLS